MNIPYKYEPSLTFLESKHTGYRERTIENASADCTIAFAIDFNSAGERLTKKSVLANNKLYIPVDVSDTLDVNTFDIESIVRLLRENQVTTVNIAGNSIYTLRKKYTQKSINLFTYLFLSRIIEHYPIMSVRTGGQTGFDEAGAKAAYILGIPTTILAPKGFTFRNELGQDISDEKQFKERFEKVITWVKNKEENNI